MVALFRSNGWQQAARQHRVEVEIRTATARYPELFTPAEIEELCSDFADEFELCVSWLSKQETNLMVSRTRDSAQLLEVAMKQCGCWLPTTAFLAAMVHCAFMIEVCGPKVVWSNVAKGAYDVSGIWK